MTQESLRLSPFERLLSLFTRIRPGEGRVIAWLLLNATVIMLAYYLLKPVREALILTEGDAALRTYATGAQALVLILLLPLYGMLFRMQRKSLLIQRVYFLLAMGLLIFYALENIGLNVGFAFYVYAGAVGVMVTSQFWAYATDLFSVRAGQRLFAIIAFGISVGGLLGAQIAKFLYPWLGAGGLMMLSAGLFLASLPLSRFAGNAVPARARAKQISRADNIMTKALGGLGLVLQDRYLLSLATLVVMLNWITTTGEYVMSDYVVQLSMTLPEGERQAMIAAFMGDLFSWITIFSSGIQLLLVSRIIITFGVKVAVAIPPLIFAISFVGMAAIPALIVMKWGVIAIKSLDYSLLNTCRNALLLPASREAKYEAKTAIDTFFFRCGDLVAAGTVFIGADLLGWGHRQFLVFDAILALVMVAIAISAGREYARKAERPEFQSAPEPGR
jgi:AAA family ATP:ADP antiporter